MRKTRTTIYVNADAENNCVIFTGIEFAEFIRHLRQPLENLMLLKGDYFGNGYANGFELLEGRGEIEELAKEDIYRFGDFAFMDYREKGAAARLSRQQIAEALYMAHMGEAFGSPFFDPLCNRFAYLAHDDGWRCRLYCRDMGEFFDVICGKIADYTKAPMPGSIKSHLAAIAGEGLLIDLAEAKDSGLRLYAVGKYTDMDEVLNNAEDMKSAAAEIIRV